MIGDPFDVTRAMEESARRAARLLPRTPVMPVPAFEFTDRAVPIVQIGRSDDRTGWTGGAPAEWGTARWGAGTGSGDLDRPHL